MLFLLLMVAPITAAGARGIEPELVAEGPAPASGDVELAIHMRTNPGWHGYWLNPGDAGLPMDVKWELPSGFSVGALRYPVPQRLTIAGLMNYVYEHDYAVLVRLKVPANARGTIPIRAAANWLACTDKVCVPENGSFELDLPIGTGSPQRAQFDEWRRALPRPLATQAKFALTADKVRVAIPLPKSVDVDEPYVFPAADGLVDYAGQQHFRRVGDMIVAELPRKDATAPTFDGLLSIGEGEGFEFHAVPGDVPGGGSTIGEKGTDAVLWAILGALVGGLLLNLMPCVFPILALKALHLAKSGGDERRARRDALAYTAGAIIGTGALGAALLAIRAAGPEAGWAFQLQDPRTVMLLMLLAVAITLNLLGTFELPVLGGRAQPAGGFATGALAAFVATPCAGPFLGAALGTALLLPAAGAVLVFGALGLGLALPFLAIAFIPRLRSMLPKPGAWMRTFQRILAVPMALTALACLWLLYRLAGKDAVVAALGFAALLFAMLHLFGRRQRSGGSNGWLAAPAAALVVAAAVIVTPSTTEGARQSAKLGEAWSEARVASALAQGKPVFVYFTADWCLTCKANEAAAIDRDETQAAFKTAGVTTLVGDWTKGDPGITRFLESQGRAGVPLYLWYRPGAEVEELPQILTPGLLIDRARQSPGRR